MIRVGRTWSIRTRTAVVFALTAMVLAAGVVVFSNLMSQAGVEAFVSTAALNDGESMHGVASATPVPAVTIGPSEKGTNRATTLPVVRVVAAQQWQWSATGVAGAGIVAGVLGWFVSRRMLRPIDRITGAANRITALNLHERIALDGPDDELRRLSDTVDDLLDRLETAFESQRRFVAQASHELRTPLAVQRAAMQIGLHDGAGPSEVRAIREQLLDQNRRTEHLVESLLVLAEADRGLAGAVEDVDLDLVAEEVLAGVAGGAQKAGVTLSHATGAAPPGSVVQGEPTLLQQLLVNLVRNAVEYNESGGFVRLTTHNHGLIVENSGPVVPSDIAPMLVEPFRRYSDALDSGHHSGLGLSIVAAIAQAHGWRVDVVARPEGGLRVDVSSV